MSPLLKSVYEQGEVGLKMKLRPWTLETEDFFEPIAQLKSLYSKLIQVTDPQRIAVIPSVSYGVANVVKNLPVKKGQNVVLSGEQFPSNFYPWKQLCETEAVELKMVERPKNVPHIGQTWNEHILKAIDKNTLAVSLGHVHWADGTRFDLEKISEKCQEYGTYLIIDGTQSIGALPFDNSIFQVDALIVAGYKWLLGPYGYGLAYYGPRFDGGKPIEENWIHRKNSSDFKNLVNYQDEYRPKANRYSVGEISNFVYSKMLIKALEQILEWGPKNIQAYCHQIAQPAIDQLRSKGCYIEDQHFRSAHLFGAYLPEALPFDRIKRNLENNQVKVSFRGNAIRISPNVYNTEADLQKLVDCFE